MTGPECVEMFIVGTIHMSIYAETIDGEVAYWATIQTDPNEDATGRIDAGDLEDLATAAQAADAIIRALNGTSTLLRVAQQLADLGVLRG